jgi:glucosyl-dolichyl phosphate glucuronosyltransferase
MSVRRTLLIEQIGGFHSDNHDDMDMCHRVAHIRGREAVIYEPAATVRHFVPSFKLTWKYFWRRCFFVNKGKVEAFAQMGDAATLGAEARFVWYALTKGVLREILQAVKGDAHGLARSAAIITGVGLAAVGQVAGRIERFWVGCRQATTKQSAAGARYWTTGHRRAKSGSRCRLR